MSVSVRRFACQGDSSNETNSDPEEEEGPPSASSSKRGRDVALAMWVSNPHHIPPVQQCVTSPVRSGVCAIPCVVGCVCDPLCGRVCVRSPVWSGVCAIPCVVGCVCDPLCGRVCVRSPVWSGVCAIPCVVGCVCDPLCAGPGPLRPQEVHRTQAGPLRTHQRPPPLAALRGGCPIPHGNTVRGPRG